jgi:fatty acid-binding protein DegV
LFKVKPILFLHEGAIEPLEQVRSKRKAQGHIVDLIAEYMDGVGPQAKLVVTGALVPDEVELVKTALMEKLGCSEPACSSVGPVIGTHTGPGVVAVAAYC